MLSTTLISNVIPPLKTSDTIQKALERMNEFKLYHLPIVNESQLLGLVSEKELLAAPDEQSALVNLPLSIVNALVYNDAHIYEVIKLFQELKLSVVPVLDDHKKYLGLISIHNLVTALTEAIGLTEIGGIITLNVGNRNNSLAQLAQIVESDNAQILSSYVSSSPDTNSLEVTLKINKTELSGIVAAFERYNYQVKGVYNTDILHDYEDRFNSLMNYLNV